MGLLTRHRLRNVAIDVALLSPPTNLMARKLGFNEVMSYRDYKLEFANVGGVTTRRHIRDHASPWSGRPRTVGTHSSSPPASTNACPGRTEARAGSGRCHSHSRPPARKDVHRPPRPRSV